MPTKFKPPTREQFEIALKDLNYTWSQPEGWHQLAIDVQTEVECAVVRISTTINAGNGQARDLGKNAIDIVVVDEASGSFAVAKDGRGLTAKKVLRTDGWPGRVSTAVRGLLARVAMGALYECDECGDVFTNRKGEVACSSCPNTLGQDCPVCGTAMRLRQGGRGPFWGCGDYPKCKKAVPWGGDVIDTSTSAPSPQSDLVERARAVIDHPSVSGSAVAKKLREVLDNDPEKAVGLILGDKTPSGKPTLEAIVRKRIKPKKTKAKKVQKRFKKGAVPQRPDGLRYYEVEDRPQEKFQVLPIPESGGPCKPSSLFKHHTLPYQNLNPVQTAVLPFVSSDVNLVVAASTSAGKTTVAEMMMADGLDRGGKAIFLSPLRAVSQEKFDDWRAQGHGWADLNTEIITGDYSLTDAKKKALKKADVIVMTSEMLDSKTRRMANEGNDWLLHTLCLVVDEAHLLTMPGRGDALECGLMRFTQQNPNSRVVLLSATMPNVDELGRWLTSLNGKPSVVINSSWRPTVLDVHWPTYPARGGPYNYKNNEDSKRKAALQLIDQYPDDKWIVFVHSKKAGNHLLRDLTERGEKAQFHNADLTRDKRLALEKRFRHGDLRIIVATSTLAWGINMPARRVLVLGIHRGINEVDPIDVKQEVGRAGRVGLDPRGDAYVLLPMEQGKPYKTARLRQRFETIGNITSTLNDLDILAFHLNAEVAEGQVETRRDALEWHSRSLAAFQGQKLAIDGFGLSAASVLDLLEKAGTVSGEEDEDGTRIYKPTMLGRATSWLYFSPFDMSSWASNFRRLVQMDRLRDTECVAWALGNIKTAFGDSFLPRELENRSNTMLAQIRARGLDISGLSPLAVVYHIALTGDNVPVVNSAKRQAIFDIERVIGAVELIDKYVLGNSLGRAYCGAVAARVKHGCSWVQAELCRLPGVGGVRARNLVKAGLTSILDVAENRETVYRVLGKKIGAPAVRSARELVR